MTVTSISFRSKPIFYSWRDITMIDVTVKDEFIKIYRLTKTMTNEDAKRFLQLLVCMLLKYEKSFK